MTVDDIILQFREAVVKKDVDIKPIPIIKFLVKVIDVDNLLTENQKKLLVIKTLTILCAGKDGITGTYDDLIPECVLKDLISLIESGVIGDVITLIRTVAINTVPFPIRLFEIIFKSIIRICAKISNGCK